MVLLTVRGGEYRFRSVVNLIVLTLLEIRQYFYKVAHVKKRYIQPKSLNK